MNVKILFVGLFVSVFALTSCKKDYTCSCEIVSDGVKQNLDFEIKKAKKKEAEDLCIYEIKNAVATCSLN